MLKAKKQFLKSYLLQQPKINRLHEMISIYPQNKDEYIAQINACQQLRADIEYKISLVEDAVLRELLMQKYVCGKTLEEISFIINYSKRHTERLHIIALKTIMI